MAKENIVIICGEPSGEIHAANLVNELKKLNPSLKISGIGSDLLQSSGVEIFYNIKDLSVMGFFDVIKKLPKFLSLKKLILARIKDIKPDAIIFVDFSGFNLRLAKAINNAITTIYYVSPQVWASRPGRVKTIKKYIKKIIVLFKFEQEFYRQYGIKADWVGHPLLNTVKPTMPKEELIHNLKFDGNKTTVSLFPGSRTQEVKRLLPIMLKSAILINKKINAQFVIAKAYQVEWDIYKNLLKNPGLDIRIVEGRPYDCMNISDFCLVCSGTATLETTIMQKPFCLVYKMSILNYLLYRPQVKLPYIGLANIIAGKFIIPEFIQFRASPKKIADYAIQTLQDKPKLQNIKNELQKTATLLGTPGASSLAAKNIIDFLK